jgi:RNA polymerase sigma factor (sigma-70 family)
MATSDAELIRRARDDPEALGELYLRYRQMIYAWFRARVPEEAAADLTAELFAQVALSLRRFRDEAGGSAAPWLYGIARNLLHRFYARGRIDELARRRLGLPTRSYEQDFELVEERASAAELHQQLALALESLPQSQREALELRIVGELPYDRIATRLGCSVGAARLRVMRALEKLGARLPGSSCDRTTSA